MKNTILFSVLLTGFLLLSCQSNVSENKETNGSKLKALIIDGENNHGVWPKTTMMMKDFLKQTDLFEVDVERTAFTWQGPHFDASIGLADIKELLKMYPLSTGKETTAVDEPMPDPVFSPNFEKYDVVITNFGWKASTWADETKMSFEKYMSEGGGLIVIHAANNSWGDWLEYNKMIGLGGWGGRDTQSGPYVYYDNEGQLQYDTSEGNCGSHGAQSEYMLTTRAPEHPIMKGLPTAWLHTRDELYERLRGPAENMTVLATAYSDTAKDPDRTGRHEPLLFTINYGKGRVFHSALGHMGYSMECVGFMTTFQRGAEWAATGKVTQDVPDDFPSENAVSARKWQ